MYSPVQDSVTVRDGITSATTDDVAFTFNSIITPPSTEPLSGFVIQTQSASGGLIDRCIDATLAVSQPNQISNFFFYCENTQEINRVDKCYISFRTPNPLPIGSRLEVTFPSEVDTTDLTAVNGISTNLVNNGITITKTGQKVSFSNAVPAYIPASSALLLQISKIKHPQTTAETSSFTIETFYNGYIIDRINSEATYFAQPGSIAFIGFHTVNDRVKATSSMTISLSPVNGLTQDGYLTIQFPPSMTITDAPVSSSCIQAQGTNVSTTPKCSASANILTITDLFTSPYSGSTQIDVTVDGVTMPPTTKPTLGFTISTFYDGNGALVDRSNSATFIASPGALSPPTVGIAVDSTTVGEVTRYVISLQNTNEIPAGGKLTVMLPTQISIPDVSLSENTCASESASVDMTIKCSINRQKLTVSDIFTSSNIPPNTMLSFSIAGVRNPLSMKPTSSFIIATTTNDDYEIDKISSGKTLTLDTPSDFLNIEIAPGSLQNGASTSYNFKITLRSEHRSSDVLTIIVPSDIIFTSSIQCVAIKSIQAPLNCIKSGQAVSLSILHNTAVIPAGTLIEFEIADLKNPSAAITTQSFDLFTATAEGFQRERRATGITITTVPALILSASVAPAQLELAAVTSYVITFTPTNPLPNDGQILLRVPNELVVSLNNCTSIKGISSSLQCHQGATPQDVVVTSGGPYSPTSISFAVDSIRNMISHITTRSFELGTTLSNGTLIDRISDGLVVSPKCDLPCYDCTLPNKTACTSCYSPALLVPSQNACASSCPAGMYQDDSNNCLKCNDQCKSCDGSADNCQSCDDGGAYPFLAGTGCFSSCPSGYYQSSAGGCSQCQAPCKDCSSATSCNSCLDGKLLFQDSCLNSCPMGVTVQIENVCESCTDNCKTCKGTTTTCSSCQTGFTLDEGRCVDVCPIGKYTDGSSCAKCDSKCQSCSDTATQCTSCESGSFLHDSDCKSQCPAGTFQDSDTNSCNQCTASCVDCLSQTVCLICNQNGPYPYNYEGQCVAACPSSASILHKGHCISCEIDDCEQCEEGINKCALCAVGYLLSKEECVSECPEGQYEDHEARRCQSDDELVGLMPIEASQQGMPLPFVIISIVLIMLICMAWGAARDTIISANASAFLGVMESLVWLSAAIKLSRVQTEGSLAYPAAFALFMVSLAMNLCNNLISTILYCRRIERDATLTSWKTAGRLRGFSSGAILLTSMVVNFKFIKVLYSRLLGSHLFSAQCTKTKELLRIINYHTLLLFVFSEAFALLGAVVTLATGSDHQQILDVGIEVLVVTILALVFVVIDAKRNTLRTAISNQSKNRQGKMIPDESVATTLNQSKLLTGFDKSMLEKLNQTRNASTSILDEEDPQSTLRKNRKISPTLPATSLDTVGDDLTVKGSVTDSKTHDKLASSSNLDMDLAFTGQHVAANNNLEGIKPIEEKGNEEDEEEAVHRPKSSRTDQSRSFFGYSAHNSSAKKGLDANTSLAKRSTGKFSVTKVSPLPSLSDINNKSTDLNISTQAFILPAQSPTSKKQTQVTSARTTGTHSSVILPKSKKGFVLGMAKGSLTARTNVLASNHHQPHTGTLGSDRSGARKTDTNQKPHEHNGIRAKLAKSRNSRSQTTHAQQLSADSLKLDRSKTNTSQRSVAAQNSHPQQAVDTENFNPVLNTEESFKQAYKPMGKRRIRSLSQKQPPKMITATSLATSERSDGLEEWSLPGDSHSETEHPSSADNVQAAALDKPASADHPKERPVVQAELPKGDLYSLESPKPTNQSAKASPIKSKRENHVDKENISLKDDIIFEKKASPVRSPLKERQHDCNDNIVFSTIGIDGGVQSQVADSKDDIKLSQSAARGRENLDRPMAPVPSESNLIQQPHFATQSSEGLPETLQIKDLLEKERSPGNLANVTKKFEYGSICSQTQTSSDGNDQNQLFSRAPPRLMNQKAQDKRPNPYIRHATYSKSTAPSKNRHRTPQPNDFDPHHKRYSKEDIATRQRRVKSRDGRHVTGEPDLTPYEDDSPFVLPKITRNKSRTSSHMALAKVNQQKIQELEQTYQRRGSVGTSKNSKSSKRKKSEVLTGTDDSKSKSNLEEDLKDFESFQLYMNK